MPTKSTLTEIAINDLVLDPQNPRFGELYNGSDKEDDLINYLLFNEAAEEVAKGIVVAGEFYPDRPLWVIKKGGKYVVKDGNRRCAAIKALQLPGSYGLNLPKTTIKKLPVLLYKHQSDIDSRVIREHAGNLFREWERIAKALEVLKLKESGQWEYALEIDSRPGDLIKLATFYKEAVNIGGNPLRELLRRGKGNTGGKTIVFERLFRNASLCGYRFKNSPSFQIEIVDKGRFINYISSMIKYLQAHPKTGARTIDDDANFISKLKPYGFDAYPSSSGPTTQNPTQPDSTGTSGTDSSTGNGDNPNSNGDGGAGPSNGGTTTSGRAGSRGSIKKFPEIKRKKVPVGLISRIKEYYDINERNQPNAKIAMARVTFECVLKYVVDHTKFNGKTVMSKTGYFQPAFKAKYTDFTLLKTKFTELIKTRGGIRNAFIHFDLESMHTIVHNYNVNAIPSDGTGYSSNLIALIEFLLLDESDLLASLKIELL